MLVQKGGNLPSVSTHLNNNTVGETFIFVDFIDVWTPANYSQTENKS